MEFEKGMYVRYEYENIIYIGKIKFISEVMSFYETLGFDIDNCMEEIYKKDIKKASFNIIDLIEVGDYVNGLLVNEYDIKNHAFICECSGMETGCNWIYKNEDIKSIVTKEQFESMEYKL